MTKRSLVLSMALIGTLVASGVAPGAWAAQARISFATGTVTVGKPGSMKPAATDTPVAPGDTVSTAAGSTAILVLDDGSEIKLNANTEFTVKGFAPRADFELEKGGVFSKIKKLKPKETYRIHVKTAVMGIRGTQFFTSVGPKGKGESDVWMCVHEGEVEVESTASGKKVSVKEGLGVVIKGGKEITPPKAYEWTKGLNWNMDPAHGDVIDKSSLDGAYHDLLEKEYD